MRTQHPETHRTSPVIAPAPANPPSGSAGAAYYNVIRRATRPGETGRQAPVRYPEVTGRAILARRADRGKRRYGIHNPLPVKNLGVDDGVCGGIAGGAALQ